MHKPEDFVLSVIKTVRRSEKAKLKANKRKLHPPKVPLIGNQSVVKEFKAQGGGIRVYSCCTDQKPIVIINLIFCIIVWTQNVVSVTNALNLLITFSSILISNKYKNMTG